MKIKVSGGEFEIRFNLRLLSAMCEEQGMGLLEIERSLQALRVDVMERFVRVCVASADQKAANDPDLLSIDELRDVSLQLYEEWAAQVRLLTGIDADLEGLGGKAEGSTEPEPDPTS